LAGPVLERWGLSVLSVLLAGALTIRNLMALNKMNNNERKNLNGQSIQEIAYLICLLIRRSRLPKLLACDNRELWDNGEAGQTKSSLSSSPGIESAIDSASDSTESSWMNSLNEETPLSSEKRKNGIVRK
jgi:predicted outer membrane lipoprotein